MDHQEFTARMKGALQAQAGGRADAAAADLRSLLGDLESAIRTSVSDWDRQQALAMLVDVLDVAGKPEECRAAWRELVHSTEQVTTYWERALSTAREDFERWERAHPPRA